MADPAPHPEHEAPDEASFRRAIAEGLASLDDGRGVAYADVRQWLLSWGTKDERPPPECR